jgi:TolB protein
MAVALLTAASGRLAAQQNDVPRGVTLGLIYQASPRDRIAVRPFSSTPGLAAAARDAQAIVAQDLDFSDRYEMVPVPSALGAGPVNYDAWNDLGLVYLVTGALEADGAGALLRITLHDVVYSRVREIRAFRMPMSDERGFRLAAHTASDEVVRWTTGEPGAATSRIAAVRKRSNGFELVLVDYDGASAAVVERSSGLLYSPAWSPDGSRLAYTMHGGRGWQLLERAPRGAATVLDDRPFLITPSYAPNGEEISFATALGDDVQIFRYNVRRQCCLSRQVAGPRDDLSPTWAPDGRRIAFQSNRLVQPHIFVADADGRNAELLSPYVYDEPGYYTSPDWSPTGSLVAFHGRSRGEFQVMIADADAPGRTVRQITSDGVSEDPSWAPDGRHIVFAGRRGGRAGLYVIDSVTGRIRTLLEGEGYQLPDWSPSLASASDYAP